MKLSAEYKKEIIKAAAFGYDAEKIAEVTGASVDEVKAILDESTDDIAAVKERYNG